MLRKDALPCTTQDPDMWFPVSDVVTAATDRAVAWCEVCPIKMDCLVDALARADLHGIYGGTTPAQRRTMLAAASPEERIKNADRRRRTGMAYQLEGAA